MSVFESSSTIRVFVKWKIKEGKVDDFRSVIRQMLQKITDDGLPVAVHYYITEDRQYAWGIEHYETAEVCLQSTKLVSSGIPGLADIAEAVELACVGHNARGAEAAFQMGGESFSAEFGRFLIGMDNGVKEANSGG